MALLTDTQAMGLALDKAGKGVRGANPLVGAVIVDATGQLLATGWHRGAGSPHAEANALANAREAGIDVRGARMYVTLEPCNHTGRTGPCSVAIAKAGIAEVIYAYTDTTEDAAGGATYLRSQGITVRGGVLEGEAYALNARWFAAAAGKRPFVTAKIASSLDGYIAAADGTSQWITGEEARADGHALRARADAIMVGTGTVQADNPHLTARTGTGQLTEHQPLRVVVGESALLEGSHLAHSVAEGSALHYRTHDLATVLTDLHARGVRHLMVEGGPTLITALIRTNFVDELYWYRAPLLLGAGKPALGDLGINRLNQTRRWQLDPAGQTSALDVLGVDTLTRLIPVS
ncbi:bifunctional diaminohydroxyphosphoribosylaminopyrimidine deaminase/5-amino-6-(5-phosphoribosylamino)uracil reductase RibD [Rothia nasimurium]|uniref:Riboflavin biosynthesis protein RibD n=1 Tax=Rothia nasimurium TaxID=85336 RepID=A0A4Y9F534_9MICC|nr:bifunctional diaminohydroxyphosphoribosylaminopyrimidine deaminase/5-amino-6-(5-phosphoribosylamino)uracil reductase RibD [Rothia nasimurium]MBF0808010.1 bifunctional diaminohydroxyphosphoribosylaminopyrimidine deaminase/5-amino-6-(5-phosphoribosylamino)uracil reductase RibD [Rothia nasimurium]TFU22734.1 bifunctional diaminohydroxyphosphoribosylaminopyrimidine deaminase/5-amino-6-(5-phosphoribosylamino)uracil reductase RibD [Rothia nasimurium]